MHTTVSILIPRKVGVVEGELHLLTLQRHTQPITCASEELQIAFTFVGASCADGKEVIKIVKAE